MARVVLLVGLTWFYLFGATEHAWLGNTVKARGDQSGYLGDANRSTPTGAAEDACPCGRAQPHALVRAYLAPFYDPDLSDPEFFTFWYMKYVALYGAFALAVISANR